MNLLEVLGVGAAAFAVASCGAAPGETEATDTAAQALFGETQVKLVASNGAAEDWFGLSVDVSGSTAVVGAPLDDELGNAAGAAYVFDRAGGAWPERSKLVASGGIAIERFGVRVAISGNTLVAGAPDDDGSVGAAYVFERAGEGWVQQAKLTPTQGHLGDRFGLAVAIAGNTIVVGSVLADNDNGVDAGAAYVFRREGASWSEEARLLASDGAAFDTFGTGLAVQGNTVIVGAPQNDELGDDAGAVYVFTRAQGAWSEEAKLVATGGEAGDRFGGTVDIEGSTMLVGAVLADGGSGGTVPEAGAAFVFKRSSAGWLQEARLGAGDGGTGDRFGAGLGILGNAVIVGSPNNDNDNGTDAGAVYFFRQVGTAWALESKVLAFDGAAGDQLGESAAASGGIAVVGARFNDNANGTDAGAAYVLQ
ncbi:MAG: FG-GAP repeat protein [Polyangiaceae bacterium]